MTMPGRESRPALVVSDLGDPAGPPVVLVHGIGCSERYFRPLAAQLAADHRVLVPDLPGFGRTARPRRAPSIGQMAQDVLDAMDRRGVGAAVLVGHSMGAQVVLAAMHRAPDRVRAGMLIGPVVDPAAPSAPAQAVRLARDGVHEPVRVNAVIARDYVRAGPRWYLRVLPSMLTFDTSTAVATVQGHVVVVRGEHDKVCSRGWARALAASAVHGELREVPGAGHVAMATHPALMGAWVHGLSSAAVAGGDA